MTASNDHPAALPRQTPLGPPPLTGDRPRSRLLDSLIEADKSFPTARKRLVGPDINHCRETLVALARCTGGWIGWEAATLRTIANELAFLPLARQNRRAGTDIEIDALVENALDEIVATGNGTHAFEVLQHGLGFRRAVIDAVLELRTAGVSADEVRNALDAGNHAREIGDILARYEELLAQSGLCDTAEIFSVALSALDSDEVTSDYELFFVPGSSRRGLRGHLIDRLLARGGRVLDTDRVIGAQAPSAVLNADTSASSAKTKLPLLSWIAAPITPATNEIDQSAIVVDLFAAATPTTELKEVLRRAAAEGLTWDDVEIATTDPDAYGIALDALCQRLNVGATMLLGVPFARTRLGRALDRWLAWLDRDLPANLIREALEAGELAVSSGSVSPMVLARELRRQRIGWGRARYEDALRDLESQSKDPNVRRQEDEADDDFERRREWRRAVATALHSLLHDLLGCLAAMPGESLRGKPDVTCAALARATLEWTNLAAVDDGPESQTLARLSVRLEQLSKTEGRAMPFESAIASLRESLADIRAWPMQTSDRKPWSASGGMVHLTDIRHAGITGRPRIFVVGLDARRATSSGRSDPLLTDPVRAHLGADRLPLLNDRRTERSFVLSSALASLRGRVTLSYAISDGADRQDASPAPTLLQAFRLLSGDASRSYGDLRRALSPLASAVPLNSFDVQTISIDARDVWLETIAEGELLRDGQQLARECFPGLNQGLQAMDDARAPSAGKYHGIVELAGTVFDPLGEPGREMSPSELEKLATCPLSWFYLYGLSLRPPNDPEYDPDRWLDPMQRGSLLHDVYERFITAYRGRQNEIHVEAARDEMLRMVDEAMTKYRDIVQVPGDTVFAVEARELRGAALTFLEMERSLANAGDGGEWLEVEFAFGAKTQSATYTLADGRTLRVKGRADRIDRLPDGSLRVIDYKTGSTWAYKKSTRVGVFRGGRQLQPSVYAAVVQSLLGKDVSSFEYRFPTVKGTGQISRYATADLQRGARIVTDYVDMIRAGHFVATNDSSDCTYCDARDICRVTLDDAGRLDESPRAAWAKINGEQVQVYDIMRKHRLPPEA